MLNSVTLIGRLGKDPEIKTTNAGKKFARFSLATSKKIKGEDVTQWHQVVVWNEKLSEVIESYVNKGDMLAIQGEIEYRKYEKDGVEKYATDIVIPAFGGSMSMLTPKSEKSGGGPADDGGGELDDKIPF